MAMISSYALAIYLRRQEAPMHCKATIKDSMFHELPFRNRNRHTRAHPTGHIWFLFMARCNALELWMNTPNSPQHQGVNIAATHSSVFQPEVCFLRSALLAAG